MIVDVSYLENLYDGFNLCDNGLLQYVGEIFTASEIGIAVLNLNDGDGLMMYSFYDLFQIAFRRKDCRVLVP